FLYDGRCIEGAQDVYYSFIHGTRGCAVASRGGDCGAPSSIYKGLSEKRENRIWQSTDHTGPYQNEWNDLMHAIVNDQPYNEVKRGVEASVTTSMGRMAAHTGQEITFEEMLNCEHEFAPGVDKFTMDSSPPLRADTDGRYPIPKPGIVKHQEYEA